MSGHRQSKSCYLFHSACLTRHYVICNIFKHLLQDNILCFVKIVHVLLRPQDNLKSRWITNLCMQVNNTQYSIHMHNTHIISEHRLLIHAWLSSTMWQSDLLSLPQWPTVVLQKIHLTTPLWPLKHFSVYHHYERHAAIDGTSWMISYYSLY